MLGLGLSLGLGMGLGIGLMRVFLLGTGDLAGIIFLLDLCMRFLHQFPLKSRFLGTPRHRGKSSNDSLNA